MKAIACVLVLCLCGALAAPEKKVDDAKRDKRGYLGGGAYGYSYPAYTGYSGVGGYHGENLGYAGYGGNLGYAGYGGNLGYAGYGGNLGYAGYGGHLGYSGYGGHGYSSYAVPAVATKVIAAPAVSYAAYPYAGGYNGGYSGGYNGGYNGGYHGGHYTSHSGLW